MTDPGDLKLKSNIIDFKPKNHLNAEEQVKAFIQWAKDTLPKGIPNRLNDSIRWEYDSWHVHGVPRCSFSALGSRKGAQKKMQPPFTDFAKAIVVRRRIYQAKDSVSDWLAALKSLEAALVALTGTRDITRVSAAVCMRACECMEIQWPNSPNIYFYGRALEHIISLMREKKLLKTDFRWRSPLKQNSRGTLKQQKADRKKKLPNPLAIKALGEMFNNDLSSHLDIVVTSACALLLSAASRVGELADVELDCLVFKEDSRGNRRMYLRWYAEKLKKTTLKPVVKPEMEPVVERALSLLKPITDEARAYAEWLEEHPDEFPPHEGVPKKGSEDPLTYQEVCAALQIPCTGDTKSSPRSLFKGSFWGPLSERDDLSPSAREILDEIREGWDNKGQRVFVEGKPGVRGMEFNDKCVITLYKLNILVRERYLPKHFPYTTPYQEGKTRVKYRDALFTVRTGTLFDEARNALGMKRNFGVEIATTVPRMQVQLSGHSTGRMSSIFERHGYHGLKVNSHAFRHELNTEMHKAGLSQLLIDAFSGRAERGSVYNHESVEEKAQRAANYHPKTKHGNEAQRLEKIKTNQPLSLTDVADLHENEQDRMIHQTPYGICVHNFAADSCPKMGACLTCGRLGCVKGDDVKLANLKEEREDLQRRYDKAFHAQSLGIFGAPESVKKLGKDLFKCDALIKTLENPELVNGDIVWNADDGWTLTNNAAVMAGMIDAKAIEEKNGQKELLSLDDLSAMLDEIEVK